MSRGRGGFGSSRGGYYRGRASSSRGYSSSRGGSPRFSGGNSYGSESRSSRYYPSESSSYGSSRSHYDDRKPYKMESSFYGRDRSPDRKRMRSDSGHDRSFGGSDYGSRYNSDHHSSRSSRDYLSSSGYMGKDDFRAPAPPPPPQISSSPYRQSPAPLMGGPPPRFGSSRGGGPPIRSRGGRRMSSRYRGSSRYGSISRGPPPAPVYRRTVPRSRLILSSRFPARSSAMAMSYARRVKLAKLRRIRRRRELESSDKDVSDSDEKKSEKADDNDEEKKASGDEGGEEKADGEKAKKTKTEGDETVTEKKTKKSKKISAGDDSDSDMGTPSPKKFIKLPCPHCSIRCRTFSHFNDHLMSRPHSVAMRRVAMKQKTILAQMRSLQRREQREVEKNLEGDDLTKHTSFCPLCKLNYRQPKTVHQESQAHRDMKKFLMPVCKTCDVTFRSPMMYQIHLATLSHIKRKSYLANGNEDSSNEDDLDNMMTIDSVTGDNDEEGGDKKVDGATGDEKDGAKSKKSRKEKKPKDGKDEQINVGVESIKKVEVYYCKLCKNYLPRAKTDKEAAETLSRHCRHRLHMRRYILDKEDRELARRAERLQRKETEDKEKEKVTKDGVGEATKEGASDEQKVVNGDGKQGEGEDKDQSNDSLAKDSSLIKDNTGVLQEDDKLWTDMDNILAEADKDVDGDGGHKFSDDDEDEVRHSTGERYDRFKQSETKDAAKSSAVVNTSKEAEKMETDAIEQ